MGELVFAAIAPHGELAIPEACADADRGRAPATQRAMRELGRRFDMAEPDVAIVLTPHNVHVEGHLAVSTAGTIAGRLEASATPIALTNPGDRTLAAELIAEIRAASLPVVGISFGGNVPEEAVMPMDWGTLIPLWFMGGRRPHAIPTVVVAPARDLPPHDHVRAGQAITAAVLATDRRAAIIASCDHGHAHSAEGPYGFHPAAATFDQMVVAAIREGRLDSVAAIDPGLVRDARADSWWQMLILHGALGQGWTAEFLSYEAPTYYGMLCAVFVPA